ncbi:SDR family NAD(P)-dependent oxidoreductase [Sphingobium bisphenolivorans]|uniref:SDR family NAD(P)-dependent oxidoreductase n=1 Tax=Sphingobium bisphenolivorans TaxID=1335760 RepID=UPI0003A170D4|nr:SDR family NAD(P)-dependent oxidoreductase [Sphingobium bisphenolivorans]
MSGQPSDRPLLVTGGAGFIGANLADRLMNLGHRVIIYDSLARAGVEDNLRWLEERHGQRMEAVIADIADRAMLRDCVNAAAGVFHLAAQVAVTTSLEDPRRDFEVNLMGTFDLLELVRARSIPLIFASTNKVYGDLGDIDLQLTDRGYHPVDTAWAGHGVHERRPLDFHTPYGCSKGAADQYVLDYARSFGIPTAVLRMSCIYGPLQCGTEDQGWVAHFALRALAGEPITLYGDGHQVRDILYVADAVEAYVAAWQRIESVKGRAFNLGGGPDNAVSLRHLIGYIERRTNRSITIETAPWRAGDQRWFVADARAARQALALPAPLDWQEGVGRLIDWLGRDSVDAVREVAA